MYWWYLYCKQLYSLQAFVKRVGHIYDFSLFNDIYSSAPALHEDLSANHIPLTCHTPGPYQCLSEPPCQKS